ncbi:DUF2156 domain-containing protein [Massilia sp. S19_KUP03_FR1]|uniref:DUF2156 domain-containing protein n=1 Tax=Massilia sp. S19_KUP03_FR1 TaxID=3025503 RepID=UPI002FCDC952
MHFVPQSRNTEERTGMHQPGGLRWTVGLAGSGPVSCVEPPARMPRARALELLRGSDNPSAYMALNQATSHFTVAGTDGFIAYRRHGGFLFQLGGGFGAPAARRTLLAAFRQFAQERACRICAVQLQEEDVALYREQGFCINQMGTAYTIELDAFCAAGSHFTRLRNKVSQARRAGIAVVELGVDAPRGSLEWGELFSISHAWLAAKRENTKLVEFMVGELGQPRDLERRVFAARQDGKIIGFISFVPVQGARPGLLHDLTRRRADAPPGVMDLINMTAIARFQQEGVRHLHFGLSPFAGLNPQRDRVAGKSWLLTQIAKGIYRHGACIYPARQQEQYKRKWHPHVALPEYVGFEGGFSLVGLWRLMQLTRTV